MGLRALFAVRFSQKPGTRMIKQPAGNPDDRPQTAPNKVSGFQPPPSRSMVKALASMVRDGVASSRNVTSRLLRLGARALAANRLRVSPLRRTCLTRWALRYVRQNVDCWADSRPPSKGPEGAPIHLSTPSPVCLCQLGDVCRTTESFPDKREPTSRDLLPSLGSSRSSMLSSQIARAASP